MLLTPPFVLRDITSLTRIQVIFWDKISHSLTEKSHICEEGGTHLRISFWHLLMNFGKSKNQTFEKMKKFAGDIILHMCTETHNHRRYNSWDMEWDNFFLLFWVISCPFNPLPSNNPENQIFKNEKRHLEMSSF